MLRACQKLVTGGMGRGGGSFICREKKVTLRSFILKELDPFLGLGIKCYDSSPIPILLKIPKITIVTTSLIR